MGKRKSDKHVVQYLQSTDVRIVLGRLPDEVKTRLRDVFIHYYSPGVRILGSVSNRGRRDINLTARLPPRVSLGRSMRRGQSATQFGAPPRGQWPPWAVRRFLLYDVLLHELGHLQLVNRRSRSMRRRFADEKLAHEFADHWRLTLWSKAFNHPDPIHDAPRPEELAFIPVWEEMDKEQRHQLVSRVLADPHWVVPANCLMEGFHFL